MTNTIIDINNFVCLVRNLINLKIEILDVCRMHFSLDELPLFTLFSKIMKTPNCKSLLIEVNKQEKKKLYNMYNLSCRFYKDYL